MLLRQGPHRMDKLVGTKSNQQTNRRNHEPASGRKPQRACIWRVRAVRFARGRTVKQCILRIAHASTQGRRRWDGSTSQSGFG